MPFVAAIIMRGDRVLLIKRAPTDFAPGKWCPPNETMEEHETPRQAVIRGVKEEVGLDFCPERLLCEHSFDDKTTHVYIGTATGRLLLNPEEVSEARWLSPHEAQDLDFAFGYDNVLRRVHNPREEHPDNQTPGADR